MARAPTSHSWSMMRCASARWTMTRTATQPARCSGETVGDSRPAATSVAASTIGRDVVVHHHVVARDQDAFEAADELLQTGRRAVHAVALDHDRLATAGSVRRTPRAPPGGASYRSRRRRRYVGHAELRRRSRPRRRAGRRRPRPRSRPGDRSGSGVRGRDPLAGQVLHRGRDPGPAGEPEGRAAEAELHQDVRVGVRVEH